MIISLLIIAFFTLFAIIFFLILDWEPSHKRSLFTARYKLTAYGYKYVWSIKNDIRMRTFDGLDGISKNYALYIEFRGRGINITLFVDRRI